MIGLPDVVEEIVFGVFVVTTIDGDGGVVRGALEGETCVGHFQFFVQIFCLDIINLCHKIFNNSDFRNFQSGIFCYTTQICV